MAPPPAAPPVPAQPALSARLLPTPAQIRFYVHATTTPPLPKLRTIDHELALRISTIAADEHVHWALLAASRASSLASAAPRGRSPGAGCRPCPRGRPTSCARSPRTCTSNGANRNLSAKSTQEALTTYFGSEQRARRVGALAAFYGALGLGRMQHGLGWHGGQLRKRVLHDNACTSMRAAAPTSAAAASTRAC